MEKGNGGSSPSLLCSSLPTLINHQSIGKGQTNFRDVPKCCRDEFVNSSSGLTKKVCDSSGSSVFVVLIHVGMSWFIRLKITNVAKQSNYQMSNVCTGII